MGRNQYDLDVFNSYIKFVRTCVMDGISPEPIMYVQCFLFAVGSLVLGAFVFKKTQDRFVLYL